MWRRPLEWNLNGTTDPRDGSVDHLSLNSLKDRHGPIRAPKSHEGSSGRLSSEQEKALSEWVDAHCPHSIRKIVTGTTAPPRLRRSAERDLRSDLIMRGALIPCIRPGMMPTLISGSRQSRGC